MKLGFSKRGDVMVYTLLQDSVSSERLIQQVYKLVDAQSRVRIKWDCLKEDENDLIVVIRSINSSFQLSSIVGNSNLPKDTDVFVYSRRETDGHIECDRKKGAYSYFIYPGKLLEKGKIGILDQSDGNNTVTGTSKIYSTSSYVQPEGKLYYQYRFVVPLVACVCTVLVGWGIFSYIDYLKIPVLQPLPRVEYIWFAVAIVVIFVICYILFPSGNWNKRACLHIIGKSKYTDKDMLHYTVSGCTDKYSVRLTDTSNDIVIPINNGETVSFNKQDIKIKKLSYIGYLQWKYIKHEKG